MAAQARLLMDAYLEMGCRPTWTCSPYQLMERPSLGDQVAWAESNAIVFANSVLGARTSRYGDFIDICAAVDWPGARRQGSISTPGGAPASSFVSTGVPVDWLEDDALYPVLGHALGRLAGSRVPAVVGLPPETSEDRLKALGAAAASVGSVAMFHAVGVTPEAATLEDALGGAEPEYEVVVDPELLAAAANELTTVGGGTSRRSLHWNSRMPRRQSSPNWLGSLDGHRVRVDTYVNAGRGDLAARPLGCRSPRGGRGADGHRHLHLYHPDPRPRGEGGDDRLGQMGLVRPGQPRGGGGFRISRRLRRLSAVGRGASPSPRCGVAETQSDGRRLPRPNPRPTRQPVSSCLRAEQPARRFRSASRSRSGVALTPPTAGSSTHITPN